jgi:DNA-binding transcriptional LysR family regulator
MELRHLRYFVAIAEERSFTRAAERLWVAQPGLSTQIRRLESELGVQLFDRHTRGVDLTAAGELFLERARTVLAAADVARSTAHDLEQGLVGSVRLGIVTGAGWPGTSDLLGRFGRDRPAVELTVVEAYAGTLLRDLRDGRLDAIVAPSEFGSADLPRVRLGREPWAVLPVGATGWPAPDRSRRRSSRVSGSSSPGTATARAMTGSSPTPSARSGSPRRWSAEGRGRRCLPRSPPATRLR